MRKAVFVIMALLCAAVSAHPQQVDGSGDAWTGLRGYIDFGRFWTTAEATSGFRFGELLAEVEHDTGDRLGFIGAVGASTAAGGWAFSIDRAALSYEIDERLVLSAGRHYTPIGYWNSAIGRGGWELTSIAPPAVLARGTGFLPVHSVGLFAEGALPSHLDLRYVAGVANGRGAGLVEVGNAGDPNGRAAWLAGLSASPGPGAHWRVGGTLYTDHVGDAVDAEPVRERILAAHVVRDGDSTLELLAEYVVVFHDHVEGGAEIQASRGGYLQIAHRLRGGLRDVTPYARFERIDIATDDPLFAADELDYDALLLGARWDLSRVGALKAEYRSETVRGAIERMRSLHIGASIGLRSAERAEPTVLAGTPADATAAEDLAEDEVPGRDDAVADPPAGSVTSDDQPADAADDDGNAIGPQRRPAGEPAAPLANEPAVPLERAVAVVVNPDTPVEEITLPELRRIFRGEIQHWAGEEPIVLVVRALLATEQSVVLDRLYQMGDEAEFRQFWLSRIFDGELASPPRMVSDLDTARRLVARIAGAISFMPASEVGADVRVLPVDGLLPGQAGYPLQR